MSNDERIRVLLREELDRREAEVQRACLHRRSGTILPDSTVRCDDCRKVLGLEDALNAYEGPLQDATPLSTVERRAVERRR